MILHEEKVPVIARLVMAYHEAMHLYRTSTHNGTKDSGFSRHGKESATRLEAEIRHHTDDNATVTALLKLPELGYEDLVTSICENFKVWGQAGGIQHQSAAIGAYPADVILGADEERDLGGAIKGAKALVKSVKALLKSFTWAQLGEALVDAGVTVEEFLEIAGAFSKDETAGREAAPEEVTEEAAPEVQEEAEEVTEEAAPATPEPIKEEISNPAPENQTDTTKSAKRK